MTPPPHNRRRGDLLDTDERDAIAEAVRNAQGVTMQDIQDSIEEYHDRHCPAKALGTKVDALTHDVKTISLDMAGIKANVRMAIWLIPILFTLGQLGIKALDTIKSAHIIPTAHAATVRDGGR
jgi:hypothetical protein